MLKLELAEKKDIKNIQKFIDSNFKKNHILSTNNKLFNWLYVKKKVNCLIACFESEIVGIYLFTPLNQFDSKLSSNQIYLSTWTVKGFSKKNFINSDNKRSVAIAIKMINKIYQILNKKFTINVGIDQRLVKFHKLKNIESTISNHHFIISPRVKKFKILMNINKHVILPKMNYKKKYDYFEIKNKSQFKKYDINELFNYQIPLKSKEYLINRYLNHPIYKYYIYAISKKKVLSLCVFRVVNAKNTNVIRMIDYIGSNKSFTNLKNFFINIMSEFNAEYLDFYSFGIPLKILKKSGLINKKQKKEFIVPDYFNPFVYKNIDIPIGCLNLKKKDIKKFRLFKGDGDQDRPS